MEGAPCTCGADRRINLKRRIRNRWCYFWDVAETRVWLWAYRHAARDSEGNMVGDAAPWRKAVWRGVLALTVALTPKDW